jgi:hypothetical protein
MPLFGMPTLASKTVACYLKASKSNAGLFSFSISVSFKVTKLQTDTLFGILSLLK